MADYYILLSTKAAVKYEQTSLSHSVTQPRGLPITVDPGTLWCDNAGPGNRTTMDLFSVDMENVVLPNFPVLSEEISKLTKEQYELLFAVPSFTDRFSVFRDKERFAESMLLKPGSIVFLHNLRGFQDAQIPGKLRYRGRLSGQNGTWFGVELSAEWRGTGTTDGVFKHRQYFTCHMDGAVFHPINKITPCSEPTVFKESPTYFVKPGPIFDSKVLPPVPPLTLGDRVVWLSDTSEEKATVKWIGILPDAYEPIEWMVGVEFDSPVGTGTGKYKNQQLFRTKQGHASLIPVMGLIKESEYMSMLSTGTISPTHSNASKTSSSPTLSPTDIPLRYADQYWGIKSPSSSISTLNIPPYPDEIPENDSPPPPMVTGAATIHTSNPHKSCSPVKQTPHAATTQRPIHQKYKVQNERFPQPVEIQGLAPKRPEKHSKEKDLRSIYDQHPYENMQIDAPSAEMQNDLYDMVDFTDSQSRFSDDDDWEKLPRNLISSNGIPKYNSSVDVRTSAAKGSQPERYGGGSVDGLDKREYSSSKSVDSTAPIRVKTDFSHSQIRSPNSEYQNSYQNNFMSVKSPSHQDDPATHLNSGQHYPPPFYPPGYSTTPLPKMHETKRVGDLNYRNLGQATSSRAKSVDNIVKGVEHEPCPLHTGHSVFYRPIARNDETLEAAYRNLSMEEYTSTVTTPSSYVTARDTFCHSQSASRDTLNSSMSRYSTPDEYNHSIKRDAPFNTSNSRREDIRQNKSTELRSEESADDTTPVSLSPNDAHTDLELGSTVEVISDPENVRYGVVRWIGFYGDKTKPLLGLEMEMPNNMYTDGTFGRFRPFTCAPKKGFYVYMNNVRRDSRFQENQEFCDRSLSQTYGTIECSDIPGDVMKPAKVNNIAAAFTGTNRGIQGHNNSCYMDATLFSMFAFNTAADHVLTEHETDSPDTERVKRVLRECIVNPLRRNFYVRADKVMNLRILLEKLSKVQGLTHAEKDPEEFLNTLLHETMKVEPFIQLSSGQQSNMYQMILDKDDQLSLPSTQQLLGLSFLQAGLKLTQIPKVFTLIMPRCGKDFRMYPRVIPSLTLDITEILLNALRECHICSNIATYECRDCFKHFGSGQFLDTAFCEECLHRCHGNPRRASHNPTALSTVSLSREEYTSQSLRYTGGIPRVRLQLAAVVCIDTSHYVSFVRAGRDPDSAWLFFDSMADRVGEKHGYNIPRVTLCPELPEWIEDNSRDRILSCREDRQLPQNIRRILCDGYLCLYTYGGKE